MEILTWRQLDIHDKPIVVVNMDEYWSSLKRLIRNIIDENYACTENHDFLRIVNMDDDVLPTMAEIPLTWVIFDTKRR